MPRILDISLFWILYKVNNFVFSNVYKKSKALKKFKADESDVQVILLSLSKAASGTNLIEASHVLLMGPSVNEK